MLSKNTASGITATLGLALLASETNHAVNLLQLRAKTGAATKDGSNATMAHFLAHEAHYNVDVSTEAEMEHRLGNFLANDAEVKALNSAQHGDLHFTNNAFADRDLLEMAAHLGAQDEDASNVNAFLARAQTETRAVEVSCNGGECDYYVAPSTCDDSAQYVDFENVCHECHESCEGGCEGAGESACYQCAPGHHWSQNTCVPNSVSSDKPYHSS